MKTKKKTYVLLGLTLAVWGIIAYKIITALNPELPEVEQQDFVVNTNFKINTKVDTFSIAKVNRDPFLGTLVKKESKKTVKRRPAIQWKTISYQGIVKKGSDRMFIVSINGNQNLLKKGQAKDSVTLLYGNTKAITMRYKNQSKTYALNNGE
ncbi:hypothetical protein [Winogradskyella flava]|uniref:Uncharacterized protein n=1 Tax=Winogradskyella flava TaxID=1884876 RepID=A0A842IS62_9FLAO|nr:hypothetical protein [Winogradskyella flava]MBC2844634.1 hypothetical protein [Winogradskyella flava]